MFNSKFGVGVLKHPGYNIGGGVGEGLLLESVLTGAVVGGGISALTGGDFLSGALTGGIGGGIKSFLPNFTDIFKGAPAVGAAESIKAPLSAGAQAFVPTSPWTTEAISATSPAFAGAGSGTFGTSGIANLANSGIDSSVLQAAQNQAIVNAGGTPGQIGGNVAPPPATGQTPGAGQVDKATPKTLTEEEVIKAGKVQPYGYASPNAANGPLGNATGDYVYNGRIYRGSELLKALQPQSFFDKYKMPILLGGAGLAYKMLNEKPKMANVPTPQTGALTGKYNLAPNYAALPNPIPVYPRFAEGGIAQLADGGRMGVDKVNVDFMHGDMYPMSQQVRSFYASPSQMPTSAQQTMASYEPKTNPLTGQATAHMASGGISDLGNYSDGGRMLKGPGDGMSDSIPGMIANKRPARLAEGEFVVPADVVSHLGNGSTDAGAKQLYAMMDKVRKARTGTKKQGKQINPMRYMPA